MKHSTPRVVRTVAELRAARAEVPSAAEVGVVMTMGALHEGHATLFRAAREANDVVVATIFVNPLQFGPGEDYERYPRTLEADVELLASCGVDVVFAPDEREMYPDGEPLVRVRAGALGEKLEGASRPGHFDGVATVVAKLLLLTQAHRAYFGQKDAQQLQVIRRMAADLNIPVEVVGLPISRDPDGLAQSSRNRYLSPREREDALALSRALREAEAEGFEAARERLLRAPGVDVDYFVAVDPATLEPWEAGRRGEALVLVAAKVGSTRLIDNAFVEF